MRRRPELTWMAGVAFLSFVAVGCGGNGGSGGGPTAPAPPTPETMTLTTTAGARITVLRESLRFNVASTPARSLSLRWTSTCEAVGVSWQNISSFEPIRDVPCGEIVCGRVLGCGGQAWRVRVTDPTRSGLGQTATNATYRVDYERTNGVSESIGFASIQRID